MQKFVKSVFNKLLRKVDYAVQNEEYGTGADF